MAYTETGTPALVSKLEAIRQEMTRRANVKAVRDGGKVILEAMIENAPEQAVRPPGGNSLEKGELRAGLRVLAHLDSDGDAEAVIGPNKDVEHAARWVEKGHRMVTGGYSKVIDAAGKTRGPGKAKEEDVQPYPFLRPAYEQSHQEAVTVMKESLAASLKEVATA